MISRSLTKPASSMNWELTPPKLLPRPARHQFSPIGTDMPAPGPATGPARIVSPNTFSLPVQVSTPPTDAQVARSSVSPCVP